MEPVVYKRGVPVDPDVEKLMRSVQIEVGVVIEYATLETILGVRRKTNRWGTVVSAWRARLERANNVVMRAVHNRGFLVLDGRGRVSHSEKMLEHGLRKTARAGSIALRTPREGLTPNEVKALDHVAFIGANIRLTQEVAAKTLKLPETV